MGAIRRSRVKARLLNIVLATVMAGVWWVTPANAVPSFSRQTGLACNSCHTNPLELTPFGRDFKLNGYTFSTAQQVTAKGDGKQSPLDLAKILPLSVMVQLSLTATNSPQPATQNGNFEFPQQASLFLSGAWTSHIGSFAQVTYEAQADHFSWDNTDLHGPWLNVMRNALSSETYVLTNLLSRLAAGNRKARDFTDDLLESAIRETIACFPVYRTYIDDRGQYTEGDQAFIRQAISRAKQRNRETDESVFDFLENTLLLQGRSGVEIDPGELYFALKFQQLTGPVMAKGVEDTAFYVYSRFLSSNDVGGSIEAFGIAPD